MPHKITCDELRGLWSDAGEFALIDAREEALFARGHLFSATNIPLSRMEILISAAVPRKQTRIVLSDDDDGLAERARQRLGRLGYERVEILLGGLPLWQLSGGALFSGMHVPSKSFGEVVERDLRTPAVTASELREMIGANSNLLLLDARPMGEHRDFCIPGAISCPSVEMILRAADGNEYRDRDIVVHCGGRTRAIIGAQTLIDSGKFRSVRALRNGTPGWQFIGEEGERGNTLEMTLPERASQAALEAAQAIRAGWSIEALDAGQIRHWLAGDGTRYAIDVRSSDEFEAGHLAGSRHVPGGQLLQTTEQHLVVQNSSIALIDDDGVRAVTCAMWLRRMGWRRVVTHTIGKDQPLETGPTDDSGLDESRFVSADRAFREQGSSGAQICDLRRSYEFARRHIKGSAFLTRERLADDLEKIDPSRPLILLADDLAYARLVADDARTLGRSVTVLRGGLEAWVDAGLPTESGCGDMVSRPVDAYLDPDYFDDPDVRLRECRAYLSWEIALVDHLDGEPAVRFDVR